MAVTRIVPNIRAERIEDARAFYSDLLGLDVVMDMGWIVTFATKSRAAPQISVLTEGGSGTEVPDISIEVDDVDDVLRRARGRRCDRIRACRRAVGRAPLLRMRSVRTAAQHSGAHVRRCVISPSHEEWRIQLWERRVGGGSPIASQSSASGMTGWGRRVGVCSFTLGTSPRAGPDPLPASGEREMRRVPSPHASPTAPRIHQRGERVKVRGGHTSRPEF